MRETIAALATRGVLLAPRNVDINHMNHSAHLGIFQAIVSRDRNKAEELLRSHLTTSWQFVRPTFEADLRGEKRDEAG